MATFCCRFSRKIVTFVFEKMRKWIENIGDVVAKMPMAIVVALFAMGIFFADRVEVPIWIYGVLLCVTLVGVFVVGRVWAMIGVVVSTVSLGAGLHTLSFRESIRYNTPVEMTLCVEQRSTPRKGYTSTVVRIEKSEDLSAEGALLTLYGDSLLRLSMGDRLRLKTSVRRFRADRLEYAQLMHHRGFIGVASIPFHHHFDLIPAEQTSWHDRATLRLQELLPSGAARAVILAMTIGERGELTPELRQSYSASGASHLLAVSGLHVGIVFLIINVLLLPLVLLRYGNVARSLLVIVFVWLYVLLCGMSPSAVRAAVMFSLLQLSIASLREYRSVNILASTAFVMLAFDTHLLFDISFELSFLAVAGILLWGVPMYKALRTRSRVVNSLIATLCVGLASTLVTMPLVATIFSVVSVVGVVINPIVILCANLLIPLGIVAMVIPPLAPVALWVAEFQNWVVEGVASWRYSHFEYTPPVWAMYVAYALFVVVTLAFVAQKRVKGNERG